MAEEIKMPLCEVCRKNPSVGVCCSALGAISHAYCGECLSAGREPYSTLVGGLFGIRSREDLAEGVWESVVQPTLDYYKKSEAQLFDDIRQLEDEFDAYCEGEGE
jgi:hypothetical protein